MVWCPNEGAAVRAYGIRRDGGRGDWEAEGGRRKTRPNSNTPTLNAREAVTDGARGREAARRPAYRRVGDAGARGGSAGAGGRGREVVGPARAESVGSGDSLVTVYVRYVTS